MLAQRRQEWVNTPPEPKQVRQRPPSASPRPSNSFRRHCLQLITVVIFAVIAITFQSASLIQSGYDLVQLKGQAAQLEKNNELLRLDIAKLKSPERIQQIATDQLGLVQSKNTYYGTKNTTETTDKGGVQLAQKKSLLSKAEASKAH